MQRFATVDEAIKRIRRGEMVLVADDEDRENEGDLTMAAEWVTAEAVKCRCSAARLTLPCCATNAKARSRRQLIWPAARASLLESARSGGSGASLSGR